MKQSVWFELIPTGIDLEQPTCYDLVVRGLCLDWKGFGHVTSFYQKPPKDIVENLNKIMEYIVNYYENTYPAKLKEYEEKNPKPI